MPKLDGYGVTPENSDDMETVNLPFIFLTAREKPEIRTGINLRLMITD
jgi:hypothetical protein